MISELFGALRAGEQLKDSASWKNAQVTTGAVSALLGAFMVVLHLVGVKLDVTPEQVMALAGGIAAILGVFNAYTTTATTKMVGVSSKLEATPEAKPEAARTEPLVP